MSTRGLYTFKKHPNVKWEKSWNVYKHMDNYPTGAAEAITEALAHAWALPRYESDEFSTAFIAANKNGGGNVRLMPLGKPIKVASRHCSDIEYRYEVFWKDGELYVRAYQTGIAWREDQATTDNLIFECSLKDMPRVAQEWTDKDHAEWEAKEKETA